MKVEVLPQIINTVKFEDLKIGDWIEENIKCEEGK